MKIISLNIGQPETLTDFHRKSFTSCVRKKPIDKKVKINFNGLAGDSVVDILRTVTDAEFIAS